MLRGCQSSPLTVTTRYASRLSHFEIYLILPRPTEQFVRRVFIISFAAESNFAGTLKNRERNISSPVKLIVTAKCFTLPPDSADAKMTPGSKRRREIEPTTLIGGDKKARMEEDAGEVRNVNKHDKEQVAKRVIRKTNKPPAS